LQIRRGRGEKKLGRKKRCFVIEKEKGVWGGQWVNGSRGGT